MNDRAPRPQATAVDTSLGADNALSLQYHDSLLKWVRHAETTFATWPGRPNCGHFFGGSYWYGIDTAFTAAVYATLAKHGPTPEEVSGISRQRLLERAIAAIRYLGFTHDSGPADCVRVLGPNPECSGKKWGGAGQAFFPSSQCGRPVSALGMAAWMLWDDLDGETRDLATAVVTSYADKWSAESPRTGVYLNTQTEENAWTGQGIYIAACMFPQHPQAEVWREAARTWLMNVRTVPDDSKDWSIVAGRPVATWVSTVTTHPDFTVENHGVVHPFYQGLGISFPAKAMLWNAMAGRPEVPDWLVRHMPAVYASMKKVCLKDGQPLPVQGQDWWYEQHPEAAVAHCAMNVYLDDPEAAYLERVSLDYLKRVQDSNAGGRIYHSLSDRLKINDTQTIEIKEVYAAYYIASCYLMHYYSGPGVGPVSEGEFGKRYSGVWHFPHGGFVVHRRPESMASFSWRNAIMALTMPRDGMWVTVPQLHSLVGDIEVADAPRQLPRLTGHGLWTGDDGFAVAACLQRGAAAIEQRLVFASLPNGTTVYLDAARATRDVEVIAARRGLVGVRNERYSCLPGLADGRRIVYTSLGEASAPMGFEDCDDRHLPLGAVDWVNLDDKLGYVVVGGRGAHYLNRHRYPRWKGFEDTLYLDYSDVPQRYAAGEAIGSVLIVTVPDEDHLGTAALAAQVRQLDGPDWLLGAMCADYLVLGSFAPRSTVSQVSFPVLDRESVPLYPGHQHLGEAEVVLSVPLQGLSARYMAPAAAMALPPAGACELDVDLVGSRVIVSNLGDQATTIGIRGKDGPAHYCVAAHGVSVVEVGV